MLTNSQIFEEIKKILIGLELDWFDKAPIITPDFNLGNASRMGMDSLDLLEFFMQTKEHFGIDIPDNDIMHMSILSDVCACVQKELVNKQVKQIEQKKNTNQVKNTLFKRIFTKTR